MLKKKDHKKLYIETSGFRMDVAGSETVAAVWRGKNHKKAAPAEEAGAIFLNTCPARGEAEKRIWQQSNLFNNYKNKNNGKVGGRI